MMINYLTRRRPGQHGGGGSDFQRLLSEQPAADEEQATLFDLEQEREVFHWAAERVRRSIQPATWKAFWQTSVDGEPIADAARSLGLSAGAVYAARSRVMARLKQVIDDWRAATEGQR
jgi:RNA polymerase sigma-70 factor (ECF subfamily)